MKKLIYVFSLLSVFVLFNSCDNKEAKKCNKELEKIKVDLQKANENIIQLEHKIKNENTELLSPSIAKGGKLKDGILTYELLVPKGFYVASGPTLITPNQYSHVIKPINANSRYSEINNDKKKYSFSVNTSLSSVYIHSETETVFGITKSDEVLERKHRGSIIIGD